jgi:hypothetical protein
VSQPSPFTRSYSYTNSFAANPTQTFPGSALDPELNDAKATLDQVLQNLTLLQNDDGTVLNGSIGPRQLSPTASDRVLAADDLDGSDAVYRVARFNRLQQQQILFVFEIKYLVVEFRDGSRGRRLGFDRGSDEHSASDRE